MIEFSEWETRTAFAANTVWGSIWTAHALLEVAVVGQKEQIHNSLWSSGLESKVYSNFSVCRMCSSRKPTIQTAGYQHTQLIFSIECEKVHCCNSNTSWWLLRSFPRAKLIPCSTLGSIYPRPSSVEPLFWKKVPERWTSILKRNRNERRLTRKLYPWKDCIHLPLVSRKRENASILKVT